MVVIVGCGFLGHHIVSQLPELNSPIQVTVIDIWTTKNGFPLVSYYDGDITEKVTVLSVFQMSDPGSSFIFIPFPPLVALLEGSGTLYYKVDVDGIRNLLECAGHIHGDVSNLVTTYEL